MRWLVVARVVPLIVYPFVIYVAIEYIEAKYLAVVLLAALVLRYRGRLRLLTDGLDHVGWIVAAVVVTFVALVWWSNDERWLRLYPALINAATLALFAYTLYRPPSMIERFARLQGGDLPAPVVRYTYTVTQAWCAFLLLNGSMAAYSALCMSRASWALYNGLIAYLLMGALFAGEWAIRRRRFGGTLVE